MTPRELFKFACRMRTNLSAIEIERRVNSLVNALKLEECLDIMVGTELIKGISGGERKRTSIGYELITNPSLLFLDEPTSGLDSFTALSIIKLLKTEAERGMTIIATIH
jgi:ABC-type multidrug transport system ATPase subunit